MGTLLPWQSIQIADFNKKKKKKKIQTFNPSDQGYCRWNLGQIGLVASEDMSFETIDAKQQVTDVRQRRKTAYPISSPGAFGSGELKQKT